MKIPPVEDEFCVRTEGRADWQAGRRTDRWQSKQSLFVISPTPLKDFVNTCVLRHGVHNVQPCFIVRTSELLGKITLI